ncbi:unnamed protein product [Ectocarpus sp. CCAP 1310/34]|nr:unnamed protein product [Ectocarpus sp. CCAP 1310/34]
MSYLAESVDHNQYLFIAPVSTASRRAWGSRATITQPVVADTTIMQLRHCLKLSIRHTSIWNAAAHFGKSCTSLSLRTKALVGGAQRLELRPPGGDTLRSSNGLKRRAVDGTNFVLGRRRRMSFPGARMGAVTHGELADGDAGPERAGVTTFWSVLGDTAALGMRRRRQSAARCGDFDGHLSAFPKECPFDTESWFGAAREGDMRIIKRLNETANLEVLQWMRTNGCPWNERTCSEAAKGGHLERLQWAGENGCAWDSDPWAGAAGGEHLQISRWTRANGCPWDQQACSIPAEGGNPDILQWLRGNGSKGEHLERLQRATNECAWDSDTSAGAAWGQHLEIRDGHERTAALAMDGLTRFGLIEEIWIFYNCCVSEGQPFPRSHCRMSRFPRSAVVEQARLSKALMFARAQHQISRGSPQAATTQVSLSQAHPFSLALCKRSRCSPFAASQKDSVSKASKRAWGPRATIARPVVAGTSIMQLRFCLKLGLPSSIRHTSICTAAARFGKNLNLLVLAHKSAGGFARRAVAEWMRTNGCPWDERTCSKAAKGGHPDLVQWARENGCAWVSDTSAGAAWGQHLELLRWTRVNGSPRNRRACSIPADRGNLEILCLLVPSANSQGCGVEGLQARMGATSSLARPVVADTSIIQRRYCLKLGLPLGIRHTSICNATARMLHTRALVGGAHRLVVRPAGGTP